jgi:hypothetical protein
MAREIVECSEIEVSGVSRDVAGGALISLIKDKNGNIMLAFTIDANPIVTFTGAGLAKGALIIKTDAGVGSGLYQNEGTTLVAALALL